MTPEAILRQLFAAAVDAAQPSKILPGYLPDPASVKGRTIIVGAGKASAAMAATLEKHWHGPLEGLVVTRYGHAVPCSHIEIVEAAHPVPDTNGRQAAARILEYVSDLNAQDLVIALISGGGSSLLTLLPEGCTQEHAVALNTALLASGASIDEMNCIRRHLSQIAGGRLAAAAYPAQMLALLISDVPGDDPVNIASGPTVGDPTHLADALKIINKYNLDLPDALIAALNDPMSESIKPGDLRLSHSETKFVATPKASLQAAAKTAEELGLKVQLGSDALEGDARETGRQLARLAMAARPDTAPILQLSGGETTVTLPKDGRQLGCGGRNVDFLLGLAEELQGAANIYALAADTDGIDGMAEVAGAIVTPTTLSRAKAGAFQSALQSYDGHGFFERLGDQIITGPTLTNVNDFRAILIYP